MLMLTGHLTDSTKHGLWTYVIMAWMLAFIYSTLIVMGELNGHGYDRFHSR